MQSGCHSRNSPPLQGGGRGRVEALVCESACLARDTCAEWLLIRVVFDGPRASTLPQPLPGREGSTLSCRFVSPFLLFSFSPFLLFFFSSFLLPPHSFNACTMVITFSRIMP